MVSLIVFAAILFIPFFLGAKQHRETPVGWHFVVGVLFFVVPIAAFCIQVRYRVEFPAWFEAANWGAPTVGIGILGYALGLNASYKDWKRNMERSH